ncbi:DUF2238 domain-containing protein [Aliikangiella sp. IMCC44359]|uniref:DUF2238 domain-containing protein n=1 Tax=Aliikangiella sp. IMCC44359 TaxID=3459125 RepID=UPI00403AD51B
MQHKRYFFSWLAIFSLLSLFLAIEPHDRADWALENLLVIFFVFFMLLTYRKFPFSRISYTLIFLFLILHEIGAHYTYAKVPYEYFFQQYFDFSVNAFFSWERNNFDRVVHFLYGFFLAYPIRELYYRVANAKGFWGYFFPLELTMASSMVFELFEWAAAEIFGGDLGVVYLGTQGDIWDAHKDMALASLGAAIAMLITLLINLRLQRNFNKEWGESLSIKYKEPMGEDKLEEMLKDN